MKDSIQCSNKMLKHGETILLVPKVYLVSAISPSSFKWSLLVIQVSRLSIISLFLTTVCVIVYVVNRILMWHFYIDVTT